MRFALLVIVIAAACRTRPGAEPQHELADGLFFIRALGNRCIDLGTAIEGDLGAPLIIKECAKTPSQQFRVQELDTASHDFTLRTISGACVGVTRPGPTAPGKGLETQVCNGSAAQRFAFDGDALLVGTQAAGVRVSREFVLEPLGANTNEGTRVVVGTRELSDAEYWRMYAVDGSAARPTSGFVTVRNAAELYAALDDPASWGKVIELELPGDTMDLTRLWSETTNRVRPGATLRGGRKFLFNGAALVLTNEQLVAAAGDRYGDNWMLGVDDQARVTGLRLQGPSRVPVVDHRHKASGLLIQRDNLPLKKAIVDHIDASNFTSAAIDVLGDRHHSRPDIDATRCLNVDEELAYHSKPIGHVVGNFIHHNSHYYGVNVSQGGHAYIARNLFFASGHDVTADFNAANRYIVHDSLLTSEGDHDTNELDVHGACGNWDGSSSHSVGGRAGDLFDVRWNSILTGHMIMRLRGTPCHHVSFHDNVALDGAIEVDTHVDSTDTEPCRTFQAKPENQIMLKVDNAFDIDNPTRSHGAGDFGMGDFDGDGVDDLFLGTGVTWWFSSGATAEWRFLNRMPERASALRFGDFDADGRTDVIARHSDGIDVSWAGGSPWYHLSRTSATIDDLAVGQFDADKRADLFAADGSTWAYASGGKTWEFYATSRYRTRDLRFGDFTGDGHTDVFGIVEGKWKIVRARDAEWEELGPARWTNIDELFVADFDGLGLADVARNEFNGGGVYWLVSKDGVESFKRLRSAPPTQFLGALPIGKYDTADGADVLVWDDLHLWLASGGRTLVRWSRQSMR